jgi:hypothetical protein
LQQPTAGTAPTGHFRDAATQADNTSTRQQPNNSKNTNHRANTNQNLRREHNSLHRPSYRSPSFSALDLRHGFAQAG